MVVAELGPLRKRVGERTIETKEFEMSFFCGYCAKSFTSRCARLAELAKQQHEDNHTLVKCDYCDKAFWFHRYSERAFAALRARAQHARALHGVQMAVPEATHSERRGPPPQGIPPPTGLQMLQEAAPRENPQETAMFQQQTQSGQVQPQGGSPGPQTPQETAPAPREVQQQEEEGTQMQQGIPQVQQDMPLVQAEVQQAESGMTMQSIPLAVSQAQESVKEPQRTVEEEEEGLGDDWVCVDLPCGCAQAEGSCVFCRWRP